MRVWLVHCPYLQRGGEDQHVDDLEVIYREAGIEVVRLPGRGARASSLLERASRSLLSGGQKEWETLFVQQPPDAVHIHNLFPDLGPEFVRWLAGKKVPKLMTAHNRRFFCTNGLAYRSGAPCTDCLKPGPGLRPILHNCNDDYTRSAYYSVAITQLSRGLLRDTIDHWIAPSPLIAEELERWGAAQKSVHRLPHPVSKIEPEALWEAPPADIVYAGRFSNEKGIDHLLAAAKLLPQRMFALAGSGPLLEEVHRTATGNVKILESCPRPRLGALLEKAKLAVLPSRVNESFGLFAAEAMLAGKRCIVSRAPGTAWFTGDPFFCVAADTANGRRFADAIEETLRLAPPTAQEVRRVTELLDPAQYARRIRAIAGI